MRFDITSSPFKNIHKYHDDDVLDYLDSRLREFSFQYHEKKNLAVPPCSFVLGETRGSFVLGYSYATPEAFLDQVKYEAKFLGARRVILLTELNSVSSPRDYSLLAVEVQSPSSPTLRCAYNLRGPERVSVNEDWTFSPGALYPTADSLDSQNSRLLGVSLFFCPVF